MSRICRPTILCVLPTQVLGSGPMLFGQPILINPSTFSCSAVPQDTLKSSPANSRPTWA